MRKKSQVKEENGLLKVYVTSPASEGKANTAVIEAVADYLGVKKSRVRIVSGAKSRDKVIEISD